MATRKRLSALAVVASGIAIGVAPPPDLQPSAWAAENIVVPDGPKSGTLWDPSETPYLVEILDRMSPNDPATLVSVRKSAQVGFTMIGQAWLGFIIDVVPSRTMMVLPTIATAQDFNREKLTPCIESSTALRDKVRRQISRSLAGSTALSKRFAGGSIVITGANSAADLRSKTVKNALADEVDEWPLDLDGQGDPMSMLVARQIAFDASGDWKRLQGSTPTVKGSSRIDAAFEAGDRRYFQVPCPHCGEYQRLDFFPDGAGKGGLRFNRDYPHRAHYLCRHCGCGIEEHHKRVMIARGKWVAESPGPGRAPSYHIDTLISNLVSWDRIAEEFLKAKDDPTKLKAFFNLWLGFAWEERGEAPDWQRLFARRDDYPARRIPPGGLIFTAGADVQADGIYYEVVSWGLDKQSWSVDAGFLAGDTADPESDAWKALDQVYERRYPDAYGNAWPVDAFAVDSGYNTNQVYLWTRKRHRAFAIKGEDGWARAAISSTPTQVDVNWRGKRLRRGALLWHIGTWPLKAELYAYLRKNGRRDGAEQDPPGFCHFTETVHDERFFKHLTAEYLKEQEHRGRKVKVWHANGPNHFLDCRVYAMAMAVRKGVGVMTAEEWAAWEAARARPPKPEQGSLLALADDPAPLPERGDDESPRRDDGGTPYLERREGWLRR